MKKLLLFITLFGLSGLNAAVLVSDQPVPEPTIATTEGTAMNEGTTMTEGTTMRVGSFAAPGQVGTKFKDLLNLIEDQGQKCLDLKAKFSAEKNALKKNQCKEMFDTKQNAIATWAAGEPLTQELYNKLVALVKKHCNEKKDFCEKYYNAKKDLFKQGEDALNKLESRKY